MEPITWAQLDPYGQVIGTPFSGSVEELKVFAHQDVSDLARFERDDMFRYYDHPTGRSIYCTCVTMNLPWGRYRYIPANATHMPEVRHRWRRRRQTLQLG